jgi:hypothetical protein
VCIVRVDLGVQGDSGYIGSMHVSLCVGGGEDVGGRELISWSLVSAQSLDASPCLAASSPPAPCTPPHSYCGSPICPSTLSSPPETNGNPAQGPPCCLCWAEAGVGPEPAGKEREALNILEVPAPTPAFTGSRRTPNHHEGRHEQPRSRGGT